MCMRGKEERESGRIEKLFLRNERRGIGVVGVGRWDTSVPTYQVRTRTLFPLTRLVRSSGGVVSSTGTREGPIPAKYAASKSGDSYSTTYARIPPHLHTVHMYLQTAKTGSIHFLNNFDTGHCHRPNQPVNLHCTTAFTSRTHIIYQLGRPKTRVILSRWIFSLSSIYPLRWRVVSKQMIH